MFYRTRTLEQIEATLIRLSGEMALDLDRPSTWSVIRMIVDEMRTRAHALTPETSGRFETLRVWRIAEKVMAIAAPRHARCFERDGFALSATVAPFNGEIRWSA